MFNRVVTFEDAEHIDAGVAYLRETVVPLLRQQNGYAGATASADREGRLLGVLTSWQTAADLDASESALAKVREESADITGGRLRVDRFEQTVMELTGPPPGVGAALLVRQVSMSPDKVED